MQNTGTGLAGISFRSQEEMGICCILQLVGMVMFSMVVSVGLQFITKASTYGRTMYTLSHKIKRVQRFLSNYRLPDHLGEQLLVSSSQLALRLRCLFMQFSATE
jgi:hypothetical protein